MNHVFRTFAFAGLVAFTLSGASGCKWADQLKAKKTQAKEQEAQKAAEKAKQFQDQQIADAADDARKELQARKDYLYAIEGEYEGSFSAINPVVVPGPSPSPVPSPSASPVSGVGRAVPSRSTPTPEVIKQNKLTVRIQVQHDIGKDTLAQIPTAEQVKAQQEAMSLLFEVVEETTLIVGTSRSVLESKVSQSELKPDLRRGLVRFVGQSATFKSTRDYEFAMDDQDFSWQTDRTSDTYLERSIQTNARLLNGQINKLRSLNVKITTPYGQEFFGKLERTN